MYQSAILATGVEVARIPPSGVSGIEEAPICGQQNFKVGEATCVHSKTKDREPVVELEPVGHDARGRHVGGDLPHSHVNCASLLTYFYIRCCYHIFLLDLRELKQVPR
jgi:hypothetical protein